MPVIRRHGSRLYKILDTFERGLLYPFASLCIYMLYSRRKLEEE